MKVAKGKTARRETRIHVNGEASESVQYSMTVQNSTLMALGLPTWTVKETYHSEDDTSLFSFTTDEIIIVDGKEILGFHHSSTGHFPLPGADMRYDAGSLPPVICDLCGNKRARIHLTALTSDGTIVYLGRPCVDFTFGKSPSGEMRWLTNAILFNPATLAKDRETMVQRQPHYDIVKVLAAAMWLTDKQGYRSRKSSDISTADNIYRMVEQGRHETEPAVTDNLLAAAVLRQCALDELDEETDFSSQMRAILKRNTVTSGAFGRLAYLPTLYRRIENERRMSQQGESTDTPGNSYTDAHIGHVGETVVCRVLIESTRVLSSGSTLVTMRDDSGCCIVWFATNPANVPSVGANVFLTGRVKKHDEFQGKKSTLVNRCRFN